MTESTRDYLLVLKLASFSRDVENTRSIPFFSIFSELQLALMRKMLDCLFKPWDFFFQFVVSFNALFTVVKITISARPGDNPCFLPHILTAFAPLNKLSPVTDPRSPTFSLLKWALMQKLIYENIFVEIFVTRKIMCVHFSPWKFFRAVSTLHIPISQLSLNEPIHACFEIYLAFLRTFIYSF